MLPLEEAFARKLEEPDFAKELSQLTAVQASYSDPSSDYSSPDFDKLDVLCGGALKSTSCNTAVFSGGSNGAHLARHALYSCVRDALLGTSYRIFFRENVREHHAHRRGPSRAYPLQWPLAPAG